MNDLYSDLMKQAEELRDAVNQPISSDPYVCSVYLRETIQLIIQILSQLKALGDVPHRCETCNEVTKKSCANCGVNDKLMKTQDAMSDFLCSTFKTFPDEKRCGSPKERTCAQYYLCKSVSKALEGDE